MKWYYSLCYFIVKTTESEKAFSLAIIHGPKYISTHFRYTAKNSEQLNSIEQYRAVHIAHTSQQH